MCSEQEAAAKWTPGKGELEELWGAHGALELDQLECAYSCSSVDRAHRGAQVVAVDMVVRGCCTSIVKKEKVVENLVRKGWAALGVRGQKTAY